MQKKKKEEIDPDNELRNFPEHLGIPVEEDWTDYSGFKRRPDGMETLYKIWKIFTNRLFPVLSLSYIASVLGICLNRGTHFLFDPIAHYMGLMIISWVAIAPMTWILMSVMVGDLKGQARIWYFCIATMQALCGAAFYFLFPGDLGPWLWGFQSFFVASIPIHLVIYMLFMNKALPNFAAWPLTIFGILFMIYGAFSGLFAL